MAEDKQLVTPPFTVGYVEDKDNDNDDHTKYAVKAIFDSDADLGELEKAVHKALKDEFGVKKFSKKHASPLHDGDDSYKKDKPDTKIFKGATYANLKSGYLPDCLDDTGKKKRKPGVFGSNKFLYTGAVFQAVVSVYTYDNAGNRGVGIGLESLLKIEDGERLTLGGGGGVSREKANQLYDDYSGGKSKKKNKDKAKGKGKGKKKK